MKTRRRIRTEPISAANGNGADGNTDDTGEDVSREHATGTNGHEHIEDETVAQVHSSHVSTPITLPNC